MQLRVASGPIWLSADDLASLQTDDLLLLGDNQNVADTFRACIGSIDIGGVQYGEAGLTLAQAVAPPQDPKSPAGESEMPNESIAQKIQASDVDVTVEIGELSMTIAALSELTAGTVLDFGKISPNEVKLRTNGAVFAHGALIEIGEGVGLKITRII